MLMKSGSGTYDDSSQPVGGITGKILTAISLGMITTGERLPPEPELAQQFGVAVATLRKALATLREQGIVETRRGRGGGTFVVRAPFPSTDETRLFLRDTTVVALRDFADEHAAVSAAAAQLAAVRTPAGAATRLAELAFRAREAQTAVERATADSRFHLEVAVLSQSSRLLAAEQRLQNEITRILWADRISNASPLEAFRDHLALTAAIEQTQPKDAADRAAAHVQHNVRLVINAKLRLATEARSAEEQPT